METARTPLLESIRSKSRACEGRSSSAKILQDFVSTTEEDLLERSDGVGCDVGVDKPQLSSPSRSAEREFTTGNRLRK